MIGRTACVCLAWVTLTALVTACPPGGGGGTATATTMETTTGMESTTSTGTTEPTTGEPPIDCPAVPETPDNAPFFGEWMEVVSGIGDICHDLLDIGMFAENATWNVLLVYPAVQDGLIDEENTTGEIEEAWHPGRKPLLVMEHGSGAQRFDRYGHILRPLAREGIISASIEGGDGDEPEVRAARILCTARWFAAKYPERNERLNCDLAFMGHSAGGQGAALAARFRGEALDDPTRFLDLRAIVSIAPRGADLANLFPAEIGAPLLSIQGGRDEQVPGGAMTLFDNVSLEADPGPNFGKAVVWAYDVDHDAFGGGALIENIQNMPQPEMKAKGETLATEYIVPFLRWRVLGEDVTSIRPFFTGDALPANVEASPATWWNYLPFYDNTPVIHTAFTVDERRDGEVRLIVDTFDREFGSQLSPAHPSGATLTAEPDFFEDKVNIGTAFPLANSANQDNPVVRVDWSAVEDPSPGQLTWTFATPLQLAGFSHLSLRVANVMTIPNPAACEPIEPDDPVQFVITLRDADNNDAAVLTELVFPQDFGSVVNPNNVEICSYWQFFRTLRVPLDDFCAEFPLEIDSITSMTLTFGFGAGTPVGAVMLDGIEFTSSPSDAPAALCP